VVNTRNYYKWKIHPSFERVSIEVYPFKKNLSKTPTSLQKFTRKEQVREKSKGLQRGEKKIK
jgi:hypothetical protein